MPQQGAASAISRQADRSLPPGCTPCRSSLQCSGRHRRDVSYYLRRDLANAEVAPAQLAILTEGVDRRSPAGLEPARAADARRESRPEIAIILPRAREGPTI